MASGLGNEFNFMFIQHINQRDKAPGRTVVIGSQNRYLSQTQLLNVTSQLEVIIGMAGFGA